MATALTRPAAARPAGAAPVHHRARNDAHRLLAVCAAVLLLVRVTGDWPAAADTSPVAALLLALASVALPAVAALAAAGTGERLAAGLDAALLGIGLGVVAVEQRAAVFTRHRAYPSDEGRLVRHAVQAVLHGRDPYPLRFPDASGFAGNTPLLAGGGVTRYGYPPFGPELGAALGRVWAPLGEPATLGSLGLLGTAVTAFALVPARWRPTVVIVLLGATPLTTYAVNGHLVVLCLPFLCLAVHRWSRLAEDGRLDAGAVWRAACLGIAVATQQLAWFVGLGLLLCLWLARRTQLGPRRALLLTARFAAIAGGVAMLSAAPFLAAHPAAFVDGVLSVFTQHAAPTGQGLVMLSMVLRGESGALGFWSYAALLLLAALLGLIAVGFARLAPAVPVLLTAVFVVTARSQGEYLLVLVPVWLVWLAGTDRDALAATAPLGRLGRALSGRHARRRALALGVAALLPALACCVVAVTVDGPLRLRPGVPTLTGTRLTGLAVEVVNRTDHPVRPSFYVDPPSHLRTPWRIVSGPAELAPGQRAGYRLAPGVLGPRPVGPGLRLWALSDAPAAFSSAPLRLPGPGFNRG